MFVSSENVRRYYMRRIGGIDLAWFNTDLIFYQCQTVFLFTVDGDIEFCLYRIFAGR